jgi:hypothetical protein
VFTVAAATALPCCLLCCLSLQATGVQDSMQGLGLPASHAVPAEVDLTEELHLLQVKACMMQVVGQ